MIPKLIPLLAAAATACSLHLAFAGQSGAVLSPSPAPANGLSVPLSPCRHDFQRQNSRQPARCQPITVSGRTIASTSTMPGTRSYRAARTRRSNGLNAIRLPVLRRNTLICCLRTTISASRRALERIRLLNAVRSRMKPSTIDPKHQSIRPLPPASSGFRQRQLAGLGLRHPVCQALLRTSGWPPGAEPVAAIETRPGRN